MAKASDKVKRGLAAAAAAPDPARGPAGSVDDLLSTGSTLLNLAMTGNPRGGYVKGRYFFLVGDSASGKTFLSLTCFAEACCNANFANYRLIFDDVEGGALMDIRKYFGQAVQERMEPPARGADGSPVFSRTIEEFYANLNDALCGDRPVIYVLDSMDALSSTYEQEKSQERHAALRKGTQARGDFGDGKAKRNSSGLRAQLPLLRDTGSILVLLNQTRDNINAGPFEPHKTRSGGHALTFYATAELWSSVGGKIKQTVRNIPRTVGVNCRIQVRKNRYYGRDRTVLVPIYYSYGIDDLGGCIDYLVGEGHWPKTANGMINPSADLTLPTSHRGKLVEAIEQQGLEQQVQAAVARVWAEIEAACDGTRKPRYS